MRLPFPAVVPNFKGVAILKHDGSDPEEGTGLEIRHNSITCVEFHPDGDKYPHILRLKKRVAFISVADDANEVGQADVGKHVTEEEYLKVDLGRKVMQVIRCNGLEDETSWWLTGHAAQSPGAPGQGDHQRTSARTAEAALAPEEAAGNLAGQRRIAGKPRGGCGGASFRC